MGGRDSLCRALHGSKYVASGKRKVLQVSFLFPRVSRVAAGWSNVGGKQPYERWVAGTLCAVHCTDQNTSLRGRGKFCRFLFSSPGSLESRRVGRMLEASNHMKDGWPGLFVPCTARIKIRRFGEEESFAGFFSLPPGL